MSKTPIFQIRRYQAADKKSCLKAFQTNIPKFFTEEELGMFGAFLDKCAAPAEEPLWYFVVVVSEQIVGCGGFAENAPGIIHFTWGLMDGAYHHMGLGKALLLFRLQEIKRHYPQGIVRLDTSQHTYGFFERYGFCVKNILPNGYAPGLDRYDMELLPGQQP